jgi:membrane protein DedA with SNARE-associated domain
VPAWLEAGFDALTDAPVALFYVVLGLAASIENIFPPIPADVVVLVGALLAVRAGADLALLFAAVLIGNVVGAMLVYAIGRRYGIGFFQGRLGSFLLRPGQISRLEYVYHRYGFAVIFLSRFLPMFRAVVPVFAGVARVGFWRTAIPMASASAIWYGALVYIGATAGANWNTIVQLFEDTSRWLWLIALVAGVAVAWWWRRTR